MPEPIAKWMPVYIADYLADTGHLNRSQHGSYLLLLFTMWRRGGGLPDADALLAQIAGCTAKEWRADRPVLAPLFQIKDGVWTQKRLGEELAKAIKNHAAKAEAGARGAAKRWHTDGTAIVPPIADTSQPQCRTDAPSPSHSPIGETGANAPVPRKPRKARRTRLADDWQPNEIDRAYGRNVGLADEEIDTVASEFKRYWLSGDAVKGGLRADWHATWCNRVDAVAQRVIASRSRGGLAARHGSSPRNVFDAVARAKARAAREDDLHGRGDGLGVGGLQPSGDDPGAAGECADRGGEIIESDETDRLHRDAGGTETSDGLPAGTAARPGDSADPLRPDAPGISGGRGPACAQNPAENLKVVAHLAGAERPAGTAHGQAEGPYAGAEDFEPLPDFLRRSA